MPILQRLAHLKPATAQLGLRDPHEIRALVAEQHGSSTSEPIGRLRTETKHVGRSVRLHSYECPSCRVETHIVRPEGMSMPLVEFITGQVGFRCLQCGEAVILEEGGEHDMG